MKLYNPHLTDMPKERWYSIGKDTNPVESEHSANNKEGIHLTVIEAVQTYVPFLFSTLVYLFGYQQPPETAWYSSL
jgi:hypothetical protein